LKQFLPSIGRMIRRRILPKKEAIESSKGGELFIIEIIDKH